MNEKPPIESTEKRKTKDYVVISIVVILAFGLTVMMIMYLARMLKSQPPVSRVNTPTVVVTADNTGTVQITEAPANFSIEGIARPPENGSVFVVPPETGPLPPFFDARPPTPSAPSTPPQVVSITPSPAPTVSATPAARTPPLTPVTGGYMLQLFAGQKESNVKAEMAKYKDLQGLHIERYKDGSTTWYRARCCTAPTKAEAEKLKAEVVKKYPTLTPNVVQ